MAGMSARTLLIQRVKSDSWLTVIFMNSLAVISAMIPHVIAQIHAGAKITRPMTTGIITAADATRKKRFDRGFAVGVKDSGFVIDPSVIGIKSVWSGFGGMSLVRVALPLSSPLSSFVALAQV
jgi:hypothetical protein